MGIFDMFKRPNINEGVQECMSIPGAVLIDVRTKEEYMEGHIFGSRNIPVDEISCIKNSVPSVETPIYTYCHSGARSSFAAAQIKKFGYINVKNIGGISSYDGVKVKV